MILIYLRRFLFLLFATIVYLTLFPAIVLSIFLMIIISPIYFIITGEFGDIFEWFMTKYDSFVTFVNNKYFYDL